MKKAIAILLCLMMALAAASAGAATVGICQLVQHPALDAATQGFIDALKAEIPDVEIDLQNASGDSATCATITNTFASNGVDLIMTALDLEGIGLGTPTGINVSGTSDLAPLDGQADMITELFPEAKTVGLLYCSAEPNSVFQIQTIRGYLEAKGLTTAEFSFADSNDVASVVESAVGAVDVLYIPTDNTAASVTETIAGVVLPGGLPVVAGEEGLASGCGVATLTISYYDLGTATGKMAAQILKDGADVKTMAIQAAPTFTKKYNAANAEQLGIAIPEDYQPIE